MRLVVLFGIIERAEAVAPQRVHVEVIDVLMPFCLASSRVLKQQRRSASKLRS